MDKKSTQKLLLQYIYGEMSASQNLFIEELLQTDANLKAQHDALNASQLQLPKFRLYPPKKTLQSILSYSRTEVCAWSSTIVGLLNCWIVIIDFRCAKIL